MSDKGLISKLYKELLWFTKTNSIWSGQKIWTDTSGKNTYIYIAKVRYYYTITRITKIKRLKIPNVGKDVQQLERPYIAN